MEVLLTSVLWVVRCLSEFLETKAGKEGSILRLRFPPSAVLLRSQQSLTPLIDKRKISWNDSGRFLTEFSMVCLHHMLCFLPSFSFSSASYGLLSFQAKPKK